MALTDVISALDGKSVLSADDALSLRHVLYGSTLTVTREECDALFKLNADAGSLSPEWRALFVEAITDYVVRQETPVGYVSEAKAAWLIEAVSRSQKARVDEIELLIHVLEEADQTPADYSTFVLNSVKALTLWLLQRHGCLVRADVERLRRVVFAKGGDRNDAVTRPEAEALFDINDALNGVDAEGWTEFFVKAVANAVLFETPWTPNADAELKREAWESDPSLHLMDRLASELRGGHFLKDMDDGFKDVGEDVREVVQADFQNPNLTELGKYVAADEALERGAEIVTAEEAHWLLDRIGHSRIFDANEHALLDYIRANAQSVDPSLQSLIGELERRRSVQAGTPEAA